MKTQYCIDKTEEVEKDKKYRCKLCEKGFRSAEFVTKHVMLKHQDTLDYKFRRYHQT